MARIAYAAIGVAVVGVSFASLFFRLAESPPLVKAFYRLAIAALILLPFVLLRGGTGLRGIPPRDWGLVALTGAILGLHFGTWVTSLGLTSVAASTLLVSCHPVVVGFLSHRYLGDRVRRWVALGIALALGGLAIIALGDYGRGGDSLLGDLLAFAGGLAAGLYLILGRRLRQRMELLPYVFTVYSIAALTLLGALLLLGEEPLPAAPDHGLAVELLLFLALAVVSSIGGHTLYNWVLRMVPATVVSISLVGEPLGASLLAAAFLGELPTLHVVVAAPAILLGICLASRPPAAASTPMGQPS
jgi:drug/metabolite transporter (DMT)-like permease